MNMNHLRALMLTLLIAVVATGCYNKTSAAAATQASFSTPELVGTLPDGRKVFMVTHVIPQQLHDRYIYFVEKDGGTTVNQIVSQGKNSTRQEVSFSAP